jgi:hypothetical protein
MTQTVLADPLELAKQIGYELYGEIGRKAFEELELCYASKLSPKFSDLNKMRTWTNLNFYWARGYFKSTIMEDFQSCLPSAFSNRNITSATKETMFGSITESGKALIKPLFHGYEMCFMSELLAFLGTGDGLKEKVNIFNEALEGKITTRDLVSFGKADTSLIERYTKGEEGLFFDGRMLKYQPNTCFAVGTRPLDNKTYTFLETSGFWSRFHTIQFHVTDSIAKDFFTGSFYANQEVDIEALKKQLQAFNEHLLSTRESLSNKGPDYNSILLPVLQEGAKIAENIRDANSNAKYDALVNPRVMGDIIREVNAFRILYPTKTNAETQKWATDRLPHFFEFIANPIISEEFTQVKMKTLDSAIQTIEQLVKGKSLKRETILEELQQQGFSTTTVGRALEAISNKGLNKAKERGFYET